MIYYITPFAGNKRYGSALNKHIAPLPDDAWICVRDLDTCYLGDDFGKILQRAIIDNPETELFSCSTNRGYGQKFDDNRDIIDHYEKTINRDKSYTEITGIVPAFFWLFPKSLWLKYPFDELPILAKGKSFDVRWTKNMNVKKTRIDHLYLFHYYRLHKDKSNISHLI